MKCIKCNRDMNGNCCGDEEIVCEQCGASYCLEYLGYYPEGSDERIDEGFEDDERKKLLEEMKK